MDNILGLLFSKLGMLLGLLAVMIASYMFFQANKANTAISDVAQLSQGVQTLYGGSQFTNNLSTATVVAAKVAPSDMITGATLVNPWNGTVQVGPNAGGNLAEFDVTETLVPADGCAKLATAMTYAQLTINGTVQTYPLDPGLVAGSCNNATNTLVLTFGH